MNPQALIFDFDGTLVDTMPLHFRAWQALAKRHGFVFPRERLYAMGGIPTRDILKTLCAEQGLYFDPIAVALEKEEAYLALLDEVQPIPEILSIARENFGKIPMAVASGGRRRVVERLLAHLNLGELFAAVVTCEDVVNQKPAPDIFIEAARRLGVPPAQCRAYEDSDLGIASIQAAGMEAVDVRAILPASAN